MELAKLAEARQAALSSASLEIYCAHLARYSFEDIRTAVDELCLRPRRVGETAFPDLPSVDAAVREARLKRKTAEAERDRREQAEAEERDRREHPENYVSMGDIVAEYYRRKGIEVLAPEKPKAAYCEHCNGVQLSALRPEDLRALADVMERQGSYR